jgi:hypothetical protein
VTYFAIPDPNNPKKEANYYIHKLPKQKAEPPKDVQTSPDNITAMCASGKLSPEQQAKYCQPKQN